MKSPEKIIVIKEKRSGCGCGSMLLLLIVLFVGIGVFVANQEPSSSPTPAQARGPLLDDKPLDGSLLNLKVRNAVRHNLNLRDPDSYQAIETKYVRFREGWMYVHRYRAKNGFGGYVTGSFGLHHEKDGSWTFWDQDQLISVTDEMKKNL